jgi:hypothetical protein
LRAWRSARGRIAMAAGFVVWSRGLRRAPGKAACRRVPLYRTGRILDNAGRSANASCTSMNRNPIPPSAGRHAVGDRSSCRWVVAAVLGATLGWPGSACPGSSGKQGRLPVRGAYQVAKSQAKRSHAVNRRFGLEPQESPVDGVLDDERAILPDGSEAS